MKYNPHSYQRFAADFIIENPVSALLLDMGLGKTSITLTAINELIYDRFEVRRVLVIAPLRVARSTWSAEIGKWDHLKALRYSIVVGTASERRKALSKPADIYIINRENVEWLAEEAAPDFDMLVIDELSSFKNHQTKRFKALFKMRPKFKRVVGLTGTPCPNGLMDLFAEFKLLDMGQRLGRFIGQYRNAYFQPDKRNGQVIFSYKPLPDAENRIYEKISDITVSMKAAEYLKMPELISNELSVRLSDDETAVYNALKRELFLEQDGQEITAANAAALSNKLMQIANGAVYSDNGTVTELHGRKLDALEDIIESMNGKPLLVAYWFRHDCERICNRLQNLKIPFSRLDTDESIRRWNTGELPVALIHPASAGHGLNLQAGGSTLVWFGLTWSLELYLQTVARLWRQGQTSGQVVVLHLVAQGTIDERILRAISDKDDTQEALIKAVKAELGGV